MDFADTYIGEKVISVRTWYMRNYVFLSVGLKGAIEQISRSSFYGL